MINKFRIDGGTVWIQLTQDKETCIDLEDLPLVSLFNWATSRERARFYAVANVKQPNGQWKTLRMHRLLVGEPGLQVDHKDGNGLNNIRQNLRSATGQQNQMNRAKVRKATSRFKGVSWKQNRRRWEAYITYSKHRFHLGYFTEEAEAARAYDAAARQRFGQFTRPNFL